MVSQDSITDFGLAYEGSALTNNSIDVRDLAPSLLALGELFTRANTLLNGESASISLRVLATRAGSFDVSLILALAYPTAGFVLTPQMITTALQLKSLIIGDLSLFSLIKRLKGRKPTITAELADGVTLKMENVEIHVSTDVFRLFKDTNVKQLLGGIAEPLLRQGIEKMVFKDGDKEVASITKEDAPSFVTAAVAINTDTGVLTENTTTVALKLISTNFDTKKGKWRFYDGDSVKWYGIIDEDFMREVRQNERRFGAGDRLLCTVETVQRSRDDGGIEVERTVTKVLEQHQAGEQLRLPQ